LARGGENRRGGERGQRARPGEQGGFFRTTAPGEKEARKKKPGWERT